MKKIKRFGLIVLTLALVVSCDQDIEDVVFEDSEVFELKGKPITMEELIALSETPDTPGADGDISKAPIQRNYRVLIQSSITTAKGHHKFLTLNSSGTVAFKTYRKFRERQMIWDLRLIKDHTTYPTGELLVLKGSNGKYLTAPFRKVGKITCNAPRAGRRQHWGFPTREESEKILKEIKPEDRFRQYTGLKSTTNNGWLNVTKNPATTSAQSFKHQLSSFEFFILED